MPICHANVPYDLDAFDFDCRVIVPVERVRQGEEERAMEARASYRR